MALANFPNVLSGGLPTTISGTETFTRILVGDGTAAAPSYAFTSSTTLGFFLYNANTVGFASASSSPFSLAFSNAGTLYGAHGTDHYIALPSSGAINLVAAGTNQSITLTPSGTGSTVVSFAGNSSTGQGLLVSNTSAISAPVTSLYLLSKSATTGTDRSWGFVTNNAQHGTLEILKSASNSTDPSANVMTFFPSGDIGLGGLTTDGTGVLQFPAATTSAGGITFGADFTIYRSASNAFTIGAGTTVFGTLGRVEGVGNDFYVSATNASGALILRSGNATTALTLDSNQRTKLAAGVLFSDYNGQTGATYSVAATDTVITLNHSGGTTLTLGTATNGRTLIVRTISADAVISASSNVVPLAGGSAGTAILAATAGKWATLYGDGSNWQIVQSN